MMKKLRQYLFVSLLSVLTASLSAQSVQRGVVLEYQGGQAKTVLPGVSIAARDAGSVMSDADGTFTLQFRTLHAGSNIQMRRIEKAGYEVMNPEVVEQFRVGRTEAQTLQVVMCSKSQLQQLRDGYRKVASQRYQQQLKLSEAEVERLQQEGRLKAEEYNARLDSLEEEYENKLSHLETYIDKFARIDLSEVDAYEQQIVALVQEGRFDDAITLYDQQDIPAKLSQSRADRQQLVEMKSSIADAEATQSSEIHRLRQSIDRQVTLLYMAGGMENILKAHDLLHRTFLADTTCSDARREYARSLRLLGQYDEMLTVLQNGFKIEKDSFARGLILLEIMDVYWRLYQFDEALHYANLADSLMTPLAGNNYQVSTRGLPVWSFMQLKYYSQVQMDAQKCKVYADRIRAEWNPDEQNRKSLTSYTTLLNVLNDYYSLLPDLEQMQWCATEGVRLGQLDLALDSKFSTMGDIYVSAASTYALSGMPAELRQSARNASDCFASVTGKLNAKTILEEVSSPYYSLLYSLVSVNEYTLADSILQSAPAQKCIQQAAQSAEGTYRLYAALIGLLGARIQLENGSVATAEAQARASLETMSALDEAAYLLPTLRPEILSRIARAYHQEREAARWAQQCVDGCCASYKESPDALSADELCRAYLLLAEAHLSAGAKNKARKAVRQAAGFAVFPCNQQSITRIQKQLN